MKKKRLDIAIFIPCVVSVCLLALHFVPWCRNVYSLPAKNMSTGEEFIERFVEWRSPFYQFFLEGKPEPVTVTIFILSVALTIVSLVFGIALLAKKSRTPAFYILFGISLLTFYIMIYSMILTTPMW